MRHGDRQHAHLRDGDLAVFRTRVCEHHRNGHCPNSDRCAHSHCQTWQRRNPMEYTYSSKLCPEIEFVKQNNKMTLVRRCGRGRGCSFAHSKEEELYHPSVYKTKMCSAHPHCTRYYCPFAHSPEELSKRTASLQRPKEVASPLSSPSVAENCLAVDARFQSDSCHGEMMAILHNAVLDGPDTSPALSNEVLVNALLSSLTGVTLLDQPEPKQLSVAGESGTTSSRCCMDSNGSADSVSWRNESNNITPAESPVAERHNSWNIQQSTSQRQQHPQQQQQDPLFCPSSPISTSSTSASSVPSPVLACLSPMTKATTSGTIPSQQQQQNMSLLNNNNSIDILKASSATASVPSPSKAVETAQLLESLNDSGAWSTIVSKAKELALLDSINNNVNNLSPSSYPSGKSNSQHQSDDEKLLAAAFQTIAGAGGNSMNTILDQLASCTIIDNNISSFNFSSNSAGPEFSSQEGTAHWDVRGESRQQQQHDESSAQGSGAAAAVGFLRDQIDNTNFNDEPINSKSSAASFEDDDSTATGVDEDELRAAITTVTSLFTGDRNSKFYRGIYQALQQSTTSGMKKDGSGATSSPVAEKYSNTKGRCSGGSFSTVASGSRYCSESSNRTVSQQTSLATTVPSPSCGLSPSNSMLMENDLATEDDLNTIGNLLLASLSNSQEYSGGESGEFNCSSSSSSSRGNNSGGGSTTNVMPPPPPPSDSLFSSSSISGRSASFTGSTYNRYDDSSRSSLSPTAPAWRGATGLGDTLMYRNKFNQQRTASGTAASRQRRCPNEYTSSLFSPNIRQQPQANLHYQQQQQQSKLGGYESGMASPHFSPKSGNNYNALFSPPSSGHRRPFAQQNHNGMANGDHQFNGYHPHHQQQNHRNHFGSGLSYDSRRDHLVSGHTTLSNSNNNNDSLDQWSRSSNYSSTATEAIESNNGNNNSQFAWRAIY